MNLLPGRIEDGGDGGLAAVVGDLPAAGSRQPSGRPMPAMPARR